MAFWQQHEVLLPALAYIHVQARATTAFVILSFYKKGENILEVPSDSQSQQIKSSITDRITLQLGLYYIT